MITVTKRAHDLAEGDVIAYLDERYTVLKVTRDTNLRRVQVLTKSGARGVFVVDYERECQVIA